jgi:hypothetical protein
MGQYEHRTIAGGVGHNLPQEAPTDFARAIVASLAGHSAKGTPTGSGVDAPVELAARRIEAIADAADRQEMNWPLRLGFDL